METPADVTGYGGAAGGGKTDLAVGLALTRHWRSIIFRREYPQLKDIVARAREVAEGAGTFRFNGNDNILTLPDGRMVEFGAVQYKDDWQRYKGRAKDLFVFDEATEFLLAQVRSLMAWNRTTRPGQRCRVVLTFNPPTSDEGEWIISFFAPWLDPEHPNPAAPGELRWFAMLPDPGTGKMAEREVDGPEPITVMVKTSEGGETEETVYPLSRTFIPARLADNVYLDGPGEYRRMLQSLPEPLRSQLLYGNFAVSRQANPWQVLPTAWVQAAMKRGREGKRPDVALTCLAMDVAHGGKDQTVVARRYGNWIDPLTKAPGTETPDGKSAAELAYQEWEPGAQINVDAIGYGASAYERLHDPEPEGYGIRTCYAVSFAESDTKAAAAAGQKRYTDKSGKYFMRNRRAEAYWRLREALDPENGEEFALPDDRELLAGLCAPTYRITPTGILIEDKQEIKARLSTMDASGSAGPLDCADAVVLTMLPAPPTAPPKSPMVNPTAGLGAWRTRPR